MWFKEKRGLVQLFSILVISAGVVASAQNIINFPGESSPDKPSGTPDKPSGTLDKPSGTPDKPSGTPDKPSGTPDKPSGSPDTPSRTPANPSGNVSLPSSDDISLGEILTRRGGDNFAANNLKRGDSCQVQGRNGGQGSCTLLTSCREILNIVSSNIKNRDLLRRRMRPFLVCGKIINSDIPVCCKHPSKGIPPRPSVRPTRLSLTTQRPAIRTGTSLPTDCGSSDAPKVFKGTEVPIGGHPWLAAVGHHKNRHGPFVQSCGGTIITVRHVLCAAHCFVGVTIGDRNRPTHVILGEHTLSTDDGSEPPTQTIAIENTINPNYNQGFNYENDITLISLQNDIIFQSHVKAACLPIHLPPDETFEGQFLQIVGWGDTEAEDDEGRSDVPMEATVAVVSNSKCRKVYPLRRGVNINEKKMCAGHDGIDTCLGDSGGPLLYTDLRETFKTYVVGVVSFGSHCGLKTHPGVYTKVTKYLDWILSNI